MVFVDSAVHRAKEVTRLTFIGRMSNKAREVYVNIYLLLQVQEYLSFCRLHNDYLLLVLCFEYASL